MAVTTTKANELPTLDEPDWFVLGDGDGRYGKEPYYDIAGAAAAAEGARDEALAAAAPFADRSAAQAATVPAEVGLIRVRSGDLLLEYLRDPAGTALQTADGAKWSPADVVTPEHFGAVGDGVTDDGAGLVAAASTGAIVTTRDAEYLTSAAMGSLPKRVDGVGQIKFWAGDKLAPHWRYIDTPLSGRGDSMSLNTAFNGDWRNSFLPMAARVSGAATLGQPSTGFLHNDEFAPVYIFMRNLDSGHNEQTSGNDGRTIWPGIRIRGMHSGQGGMMGFSSSIFVNGVKPGATSFLASPAAANMNMEAYAGANGVYLNPVEINAEDQGFDAAAVGVVINLKRQNKTGDIEAFWAGIRIQSTGDEAINSGFMISRKADTGIDFTHADFSSGSEAAIALKAGHRIYFEATSSNNWHKTANGDSWISYNASNGGLEVFADGSEILRIKSSQLLVRNTNLAVETGNLSLLSDGAIVAIGGSKVVSKRQAAIPNAGAGTEIATINAILTAMRTHGLIAT